MKNFIKKIIFILTIISLTSCLKKLYKYELKNGEIKVNCFYYSDITNSSMDFIEIQKNDSTLVIAKIFPGIYDLEIVKDSILITLRSFKKLEEGEIRKTGKVFNYQIIYNEIESYEKYLEQKK